MMSGLIGRSARVAIGLLFIAVPVLRNGINAWDIVATLVVVPAIATVAVLLIGPVHAHLSPSGAWIAVMVTAIGSWVLLTFVSPFDAPDPF